MSKQGQLQPQITFTQRHDSPQEEIITSRFVADVNSRQQLSFSFTEVDRELRHIFFRIQLQRKVRTFDELKEME